MYFEKGETKTFKDLEVVTQQKKISKELGSAILKAAIGFVQICFGLAIHFPIDKYRFIFFRCKKVYVVCWNKYVFLFLRFVIFKRTLGICKKS